MARPTCEAVVRLRRFHSGWPPAKQLGLPSSVPVYQPVPSKRIVSGTQMPGRPPMRCCVQARVFSRLSRYRRKRGRLASVLPALTLAAMCMRMFQCQ